MNHLEATTSCDDLSFAMQPPVLCSTSDDTESQWDERGVAPLEIDSKIAERHTEDPGSATRKKKRGYRVKALGKKLGGAISKINVAKWIDDLENDQELADRLNRINAETMDEQERQEIKRQAMQACLDTMREHLMVFLTEHPQATYEEWICNLHPDNINVQLEGLTHIPMIDHRFYVADSDHRILWNEHLNDLNDATNMTPVRHFVAARTFVKKPSNTREESTSAGNEMNLISLEGNGYQMGNQTTSLGDSDLLGII